MVPHTPSWFQRRWKLLVCSLFLLAVGAAVVGVFAWKRGTDTSAQENRDNGPAESAPKQMLSQYALPVNAMTFSPDGRQLATAAINMTSGRNKSGEIRLWDVDSGREQRCCSDFSGLVSSLAFSPDGKTLASGGTVVTPETRGRIKESGEANLWHLDAAKPSVLHKADKAILSVVFSPQGDKLAVSCEDGSVALYNPATGEQERVLRAESGISLSSNVAFSADGNKIASVGVKLSSGPKPLFQSHLQVWDAVSGKPLATLHPPEIPKETPQIKCVAFLPDGDRVVAGCGRNICFWNLKSGRIEATLSGHPNTIEGLALSRDGSLLASEDNYGSIKLWQVSDHSERATLQNLMPTAQSQRQGIGLTLAFAPDGQTLVSSMLLANGFEMQGSIKLWNVATAKEIALPR